MNLSPFIGIDWGSTHLRAFRYANDGAVLETRRASQGAAGRPRDQYEPALRDVLGDWLDAAPKRIIVCGMAGAREGWIEAPYLACPRRLADLPEALATPDANLPVSIAPGLSTLSDDGVHDVLRGEETQMFGALQEHSSLVVTPGTHSKWAYVSDGVVHRFRTYMTGELFALLSTQSALARTIDPSASFDALAFEQGARRALSGGALSHVAFGVRAEALFGALTPPAAKSYLSGLLIGVEVADALKANDGVSIAVIGADDIVGLYQRALALAGGRAVIAINGEQAAAKGLWRIANARGAS
jgi:2-dehydro-3-deoxygalactonokinase